MAGKLQFNWFLLWMAPIPWVFPWLERAWPGLARRLAIWLFLRPIRFAPSDAERQWLALADRKPMAVGGREVVRYGWGMVGGPYVLCVHGWSGRASQFEVLGRAVLARGIGVVAFDAPGHGQASGGRSNLLEFARGIRAVVDELGHPLALVGHSLGGVACMYYCRHLGKALPLVTLASPLMAWEIFENFAKRIQARPENISKWLNAYSLARVGQPFDALSGTELLQGWPEVPMLGCLGSHDREVGMGNLEVMAQAVPHAQRWIAQGQGHTRLLWHNDTVERVLGFVQGLNRAG
ncbi:MAG: alpha/beta fold hydrolase [Bacteroidetes bacterium]|nr:alpha/beta fold hydrolase [Bacteroidota bacterium]